MILSRSRRRDFCYAAEEPAGRDTFVKRRQFLQSLAASPLLTKQVAASATAALGGVLQQRDPVATGTERQLLFDEFWFDQKDRVQLRLHPPLLREAAISLDRPWEKKWLHYSTVLKDGNRYRMWYRATEERESRSWTCYAESQDGIHWDKPSLGIVSRGGSKDNNMVLDPDLGINASVLLDPTGSESERYKMIVRRAGNIEGLVSADGLRWRPARNNPFLDEKLGHYDSHNVLLWDDQRRVYVIYLRGFVDEKRKLRLAPEWKEIEKGKVRTWRVIRRSESPDFQRWSEPQPVVVPDTDDPDNLHFYTNAAVKYPWASRSYFMFPMILYVTDLGNVETGRQFPGTPSPGLSDIQFAASRDGVRWERRFRQPLINPDLNQNNWVDRNPIMGVGMLQTGPAELSMYYSELFHVRENNLHRCTFRLDGFVSVEGPYVGWGEFTTRPLTFAGSRLELNHSTSGGGTILVEVQDEAGKPISGYALADCQPVFGDKIDGVVAWKQGDDVRPLRNRPVRLRVRLRDAHLYAFGFPA